MAQAKQQMTEAETNAALSAQKRSYANAALAMAGSNPTLSMYYIIRSQSDELDQPAGLVGKIMTGVVVAILAAVVGFVGGAMMGWY